MIAAKIGESGRLAARVDICGTDDALHGGRSG
jgi:hypothetical protein